MLSTVLQFINFAEELHNEVVDDGFIGNVGDHAVHGRRSLLLVELAVLNRNNAKFTLNFHHGSHTDTCSTNRSYSDVARDASQSFEKFVCDFDVVRHDGAVE